MIQDSDTQVVNNTIDDAFLNEDILIAMGFEYKGTYNDMFNTNTRVYTYEDEYIGKLEVSVQDLKCYKMVNNLVPEASIVVISNVDCYINNNPTTLKVDQRYMLRVRDLKELIVLRRLTTEIANLQHQVKVMLSHGYLRTLRELKIDVSGL